MHNTYRKNASYLIQRIKLGRKIAKEPEKNGSTNGRGGDEGPEEGR